MVTGEGEIVHHHLNNVLAGTGGLDSYLKGEKETKRNLLKSLFK